MMSENKDIEIIKKWLGNGSINIFGRPFAGKDNQANKLIEIIGGNLIGGGDILRSKHMPNDIKILMRTGKLIPTDKYRQIVLPYFKQSIFKDKPLILSSVGRWHGEEEMVIKSLRDSGHELKAVIHLEISEQESYKRWQNRDINNDRGERYDDTEEILKIRLNEYRSKTIPVINHYKKTGLLIEVDGTKTRNEVTADILKKLRKMVNRVSA